MNFPRTALVSQLSIGPYAVRLLQTIESLLQPRNWQTSGAGAWAFRNMHDNMISSKTSNMTATPLTATDFRHALGQFATGVTVITAPRAPGQPYGMTANSFTSVSLDPFLTLVCVDQRSHLLPLLKQGRFFGVNVLKEHQQAVSVYFAQSEQTPDAEAKLGIRYRWTEGGIPLLEDTLAQIVCRVVASYIAGDHTIFLGEVQSADLFPGEPLLFFRSRYRQLAPPR
jgi:flavin reductase (DIM6/NTAB) family NADH-FMN oxidoreductase RutF